MSKTVDSLNLIELPHHLEENGSIVVVEGMFDVPFKIARVFQVFAPGGAIRGKHAHRECSQFLICTTGLVEVLCDDGQGTLEFVLEHPNVGLLIPPGIWSQQTYRGAHAALTVLCDRLYEADDYIRDYESFKKYRSNALKGGER